MSQAPERRSVSQDSSREENRVRCPTRWATAWSIEMPTWMSALSVLRARAPVRNVALARAWSPPPSLPGRGVFVIEAADDLETGLQRGQRFHGLAEGEIRARSTIGHQLGWCAPLGNVTKAMRTGIPEGVAPRGGPRRRRGGARSSEGRPNSKNGSAMHAPDAAQKMPPAQREVALLRRRRRGKRFHGLAE